MNYNDRLFKIYDELKNQNRIKTYVELADIIGSNKAGVNDLKKGNKKASLDIIQSMILSYPDINLYWFLTGKGDMFLKKEEIFPSDDQKVSVSSRKLIPFFDGIVEAGTTVVANMDGQYPAEMVDAGDFFQDATAVMQVHGNSMYPAYEPGAIIALKEVFNKCLVIYGQDYVIETSEYRVIKRLQRSDNKTCWLACSTNTEIWEQGILKGRLIHEPFDVPINEVRRLYLVLGQMQRNHSSKVIFSNSL